MSLQPAEQLLREALADADIQLAGEPPRAPRVAPKAVNTPTPKAKRAPESPLPGSPPRRSRFRRDDLTLAALGLTLGLICAMFPWYIFLNPDEFGIRAIRFDSKGDALPLDPMVLNPQSQRVGAAISADEAPQLPLDLFATGSAKVEEEEEGAEGHGDGPSVQEQPFPLPPPTFKLIHAAAGRAMMEDDTGIFIVQKGTRLPDDTIVVSVEQREGQWVVVTTNDRVMHLEE